MEQLLEISKILVPALALIITAIITGLFGVLPNRQKNRKKQEKNNNVQKKTDPKRTDNEKAKKPKKNSPPAPNLSGKTNPGDNFDDKTVGDFIVSGTDEITIDVYIGSRNSIAIEAKMKGKPVTTIGIKAFEGKQLTNVTIGVNINRIEARAFYKNKLTSVTIPNNVTYIGKEAFAANHLTRVTFQGSGVKIEDDTFDGNLAEVYKNSGVGTYRPDITNKTWVKDDYICSGTNEITIIGYTGSERNLSIPEIIGGIAVITIGDNAFINKQLTSVRIPYNVTSIGSSAFSGNALTSVRIPYNVTSIGSSAFSGNALTSVDIPRSISYIGSNAFFGNPLTTINIWENVTLGTHSLGVGFDEFYNTGGRLRGTYYYSEDADHMGCWSGPYESNLLEK